MRRDEDWMPKRIHFDAKPPASCALQSQPRSRHARNKSERENLSYNRRNWSIYRLRAVQYLEILPPTGQYDGR